MVWNARLDFRHLPGPVFDPPRRETAGRVTRWPCLWHNWKIDNLGVSDVTESEIRTAAGKLKNNKSSFSDKIKNEMIKSSLNELKLMPVYLNYLTRSSR